MGLEYQQQEPDLDTVLIAVGGGGSSAASPPGTRGRVRIIGVEPTAAPTLTYARAAGKPVDAPAGGLAADSLAPRQVGELMFPLAQSFVEDVILVEDDDIRHAQHVLWDTLRVVAEPGGAAALAAITSGRYSPMPGERMGILVCGANTDPALVTG